MIGRPYHLFCIEAYPIRYLVNLKAGSTFLKTLLYRLETGWEFSEPNKVHKLNSIFLREKDLGLSAKDIRAEEFAFTTLRDPVARFRSLFNSKFYAPPASVPETSHPDNRFDEIYWYLKTHSKFDFAPKDMKTQRSNAHCLLDAIEAGFEKAEKTRTNPHWARQTGLYPAMQDGHLKVLLAEDLNLQLGVLLSPLIPDIKEILDNLGRPNQSGRKTKIPDIIDKKLTARIQDIYQDDIVLYDRFAKAWSKLDGKTLKHTDIPRAV